MKPLIGLLIFLVDMQTTMMVREEEGAGLVRLRERRMQISAEGQPQVAAGAGAQSETITRWLLVTELFCPGDTFR